MRDIHTLQDLKQAKQELKLRIRQSDNALKSGLIYSMLNRLFSGKKTGQKTGQKPLSPVWDSGTLNALRFLGSKERSGFAKTAGRVLPLVAAIAVPVLARFAVKWVQKKSGA